MKAPALSLAGAGTLLILTLSYINGQALGTARHVTILDNLRRLSQLDATLNQHLLSIHYRPRQSHGVLESTLGRLHRSYDALDNPRTGVRRRYPDVDRHLNDLGQALTAKAVLIERFKSDNNKLTGAVRDFPAHVAREMERTPANAAGKALLLDMEALLQDTLLYSLLGDEALKFQAQRRAGALRSTDTARLLPLRPVLERAGAVMALHDQVDAALGRLLDSPIERLAAGLENAYLVHYQVELRRGNQYRDLLYVFSGVLLAYIAYILFRLKNTATVLGRTNRELTQQVAQRTRMETALFREKERAQVTLESIGDGVITTDIHARVDYLNPVAEKLTGWRAGEARHLPLATVFRAFDESNGAQAAELAQHCLRGNRSATLTEHTVLIDRSGKECYIEDSIAPIRNREGAVIGTVIVFHDISRTRALARELAHQASHDALTGLLNRREFEARLARELARARDDGGRHVLCYMDLDQFKIVNDTCGHMAGDEMLKQLSRVLQRHLERGDLLARLGGDEFGVLFQHQDLARARQAAEALLDVVKNFRFQWQGIVFEISASIGLSAIDRDSADLPGVMSAADMACYAAKELGRNRVHVFREDDAEIARRRDEMRWVARINQALQENRLELFRQAIVALDPRQAQERHYELLLRLRDENGNRVAPDSFIPAAERYNLMPAIDRWVIQHAFDYLARRTHADRAAVRPLDSYAINVSGTSLNDEGFLEFIRDRLREYALPASMICFEITETAAIANLHRAIQFINALKQLGCRFSLDDFGSGLSSFAYLKNLRVDYLKIDGSFIKGMAHDPIDGAIVESINQIGHAMGLRTIAECMEEPAVLERLRTLGVDYVQGYGVREPLPLHTRDG
ncbi:MAG: EAL domain-containing protein [Gammaproteobacteria bacterium]|nr:EAL domain-containing protein [Gammaproteobacteria bacterium]